MKKLILIFTVVFLGINASAQVIPSEWPVISPTLAIRDSIWYDTVQVRLLISDSCDYRYRIEVDGSVTKVVDWKIYPMMGYSVRKIGKYGVYINNEFYLDDKKKRFTPCKNVW